MKHLILGIAVLVLLLALCLGAAWSLDRTAEQVCSLLEAAWSSETLDEAAGFGRKTGVFPPLWWTTSGWRTLTKAFPISRLGCSWGKNRNSPGPVSLWSSRSGLWRSRRSPITTTSCSGFYNGNTKKIPGEFAPAHRGCEFAGTSHPRRQFEHGYWGRLRRAASTRAAM